MKGKSLNLTIISNFLSNSSQPNKINPQISPLFIKDRFFSSYNRQNDRGQFRKPNINQFNNQNNDHDHEDNDNFSRKNGRNLDTHQKISNNRPVSGRNFRDERHSPRFRRNNADPDHYRPFNDEGRRGNLKNNNDDGEKNEGRPSISELLDRPIKGEEDEGSDFLEKFKLGGVSSNVEEQVSKGEAIPELKEEKIEAPEEADVIFKKMKQSGLIPNAVSMLDGLCKDGLVHEAMKLFGLMREKGTMPEVVVYTSVVEGFCKAEKYDDAKRVFRKMQSNGIAPNAFSYAVLVKGLCKGNRLEEAVDLCVEMLGAGHLPNVSTFVGLVHGFCKEAGGEEAKKVIGTLKQKGFLLDDKAVRNYLDKSGPSSPVVWEAIFGPKKTTKKIIL